MDFTCYPQIYLHGDKQKAKDMEHFALKQFDILSHAMTLSPKSIYSPNGLNQDVRRVFFNTGEVIECKKYFNQGQIHIYVPFDDSRGKKRKAMKIGEVSFIFVLSTYDRQPITLTGTNALSYFALYDSSGSRGTSPTDPDDGLVYLYPSDDYPSPVCTTFTEDGITKGMFTVKSAWLSDEGQSEAGYWAIYAYNDWIPTQFRQRYINSYVEINGAYGIEWMQMYPNGEIMRMYNVYDYWDDEDVVDATKLDFRFYSFMMYHIPHGIDFTKGFNTASALDTYYTKFMRWRSPNLITAGSYEDVLPGCYILVKMKGYCFFWDVLKNDYATLADDDGTEIDTEIRAYDDDVTAWMFSYTEPYVDSEYVLWSQHGMYGGDMSAVVPGDPSYPETPRMWFVISPSGMTGVSWTARESNYFSNPSGQDMNANNTDSDSNETYNAEWGGVWDKNHFFTVGATTDYPDYWSGEGVSIYKERYYTGHHVVMDSDKYKYFSGWLPFEELAIYNIWFYASRKAIVQNSTGIYEAFCPIVKEIHTTSDYEHFWDSDYWMYRWLGTDVLHHTYDSTTEHKAYTTFTAKTPLGDMTTGEIDLTESTTASMSNSDAGAEFEWENIQKLELPDGYTYSEKVGYSAAGYPILVHSWSATTQTRKSVTLENGYFDTACVYSRYFVSHMFIMQTLTHTIENTKAPGEADFVETDNHWDRDIAVRACCKLTDPTDEILNPFDITEEDRNPEFEAAIQLLIDRIYEEYPVSEESINTWDNHMSCHMYMPDRNKSGIRSESGMAMVDEYTGMPINPGLIVEKEEDEPINPGEIEIE